MIQKLTALERESKSMVLIIELAGGINTNTEAKLESDCLKIYKNDMKSLKKNTKKKSIYCGI